MPTVTNAGLARDIRELKTLITEMGKTQIQQGRDITSLNNWRLATEAATKAVDDYKRKEEQAKYDKTRDSVFQNKAELLKQLVPFVIALGALIYAYSARIH